MSEQMTSNKPYIVRAFYQWLIDNRLTPFIAVDTSVYGVIVPLAYTKDDQIVLNIAPVSVGAISLAGNAIEFSARFGGKLEQLVVPYGAISAIYAKENGAGTSFPIEHVEIEEQAEIPAVEAKTPALTSVSSNVKSLDSVTPKSKAKASLKVIK
jgi:stringent starvation protein B